MTREAPEKRCATLDPAMFWSTHPSDHKAAKKVCATCPALAWCQRLTDRALTDPSYGLGVEGTWAGVLYRAGRVVTVMESRGRRAVQA
jgi:hypothetical protein